MRWGASRAPLRRRPATWVVVLSVAAALVGCGDDDGGGQDASTSGPDAAGFDMAAAGLEIAVDYGGGECAAGAEAHGAPEYLLRLDVVGPPETTVAIWAERPSCGVAPSLFREVVTDTRGVGSVALENGTALGCDDGLLGGWRVWAEAAGARSTALAVTIGSEACGLDCASAASHCPPMPAIDAGSWDSGVSDAGTSDAGGMDAGAPEPDAGPGTVVLLEESGCFFTPTTSELFRRWRVGANGTAYASVRVRFDVVAGPFQPHIVDPSNRTEHILFGLSRANQAQSYQRYLMGASAVDFRDRSDQFRMYGREAIAMGYMSFTADSGSYRWTQGTRYTVDCTLDAAVPIQRCQLRIGATVEANRQLPVTFLDGATHLSTAFDLELGTDQPIDHDHLQSPRGWEFCDLRVSAERL